MNPGVPGRKKKHPEWGFAYPDPGDPVGSEYFPVFVVPAGLCPEN
jgi:hypothetical protein